MHGKNNNTHDDHHRRIAVTTIMHLHCWVGGLVLGHKWLHETARTFFSIIIVLFISYQLR